MGTIQFNTIITAVRALELSIKADADLMSTTTASNNVLSAIAGYKNAMYTALSVVRTDSALTTAGGSSDSLAILNRINSYIQQFEDLNYTALVDGVTSAHNPQALVVARGLLLTRLYAWQAAEYALL